jgi:hypothetical protein
VLKFAFIPNVGFRCTWASYIGNSCCKSSFQYFIFSVFNDRRRYCQLKDIPTPYAITFRDQKKRRLQYSKICSLHKKNHIYALL